jgi:hypothetical protein
MDGDSSLSINDRWHVANTSSIIGYIGDGRARTFVSVLIIEMDVGSGSPSLMISNVSIAGPSLSVKCNSSTLESGQLILNGMVNASNSLIDVDVALPTSVTSTSKVHLVCSLNCFAAGLR